MSRRLRILVWPRPTPWLTAFCQGTHEYLLPVPGSASAVPDDVDVVVLQRPEELARTERWLGRTPGRDLPAIYVEHDPPPGGVADARHPMADRLDLCVVHVTHFNELMWDTGTTPTTVIEPGVVDPGALYCGSLARAAVVTSEPVRNWRVSGTDLLPRFAEGAELDVFGTGLDDLNAALTLGEQRLNTFGELPETQLHEAMARRRVYLHAARWTSLELPMITAMQLGMPVVALASTEVVRAVPPEAGIVSTCVDDLTAALRELMGDRVLATQYGKQAREFALSRYALEPFLRRWDDLLSHTAR